MFSRESHARPIEIEDLPYIFAAYRLGGLPDLEKMIGPGLKGPDFDDQFEILVDVAYDAAWTIYAHSKEGYGPVGIVFGRNFAEVMWIGDMQWFPWASSRNKIEGTARFLLSIRDKDFTGMWSSRPETADFYNHLASYGLIRRLGTHVMKDSSNPIWQVRHG